MALTLTVHRGTREIGGSCIEIAHSDGPRLILDAGRPLDAPVGASGLLPASLDRTKPVTVLISHPHQDHHGLLQELPEDWAVWTGQASARLIAINDKITKASATRELRTWTGRNVPLQFGPFTVTPILTDHSAFDSYMLLVEGGGRRILYTGDFRRHGRKSSLVDALMARPPTEVDVLVCEGTNLGTEKPTTSESELEDEFAALFRRTRGRVFVAWSGQNIDRTVTLYRAAKRIGRTLAIDLYTADVLDRIADGTKLPRAGFPNLRVVVTSGLRSFYARQGCGDFVSRMVPHGVAARNIRANAIVMLRRSLILDYSRAGLNPTKDDAFSYLMWRGYLKETYHAEPLEWCRTGGAELAYLHTSGHASPSDLRAFAAAISPTVVVPVHGQNWDVEAHGFGAIRRLGDGEPWTLQ